MLFLGILLFLIFILFVIATQIDVYSKIVLEKYRFRYFSLRDKLAMLVIQNKVKENSWEYRDIVDTINFHIDAVEKVSTHKIMSLLVQYYTTSKQEEQEVSVIEKDLTNPEIVRILVDFMDITADLLERNSKKWQLRLPLQPFRKQKNALDHIRFYQNRLKSRLTLAVQTAV